MDSEIGNIEAAESERLLSGNVVKPHIYGSKEPVCACVMCMLYKTNSIYNVFFRLFTRLFAFFTWLCFIYKQYVIFI